MALARLALKNLQQSQRASFLSTPAHNRTWASQILRRLSSAADQKPESGREVAVADGTKKSRRKRRGGLWRSNSRDKVPALWESFPSGLGNALLQATENINRLMENFSPSQLIGRATEHDDVYKLKYHMPGLAKEDVKITINDGVLSIRGEHKHEEEDESDNEVWSARSYGYYNTSLVLPEDAKVEEIKAEMKDGVLNIVIPKSESANKDVKEVKIQ